LRITKIIQTTIYVTIMLPLLILAQNKSEIFTLTENFDKDPGWENHVNRVEGTDCPIITQNFGWGATNNNGDGIGEIGGTIFRSTTPASYAMPIGKSISLHEPFSASGKISVIAPEKEGFGFYLGFFNSERDGWRLWSSVGARIGKLSIDVEGEARWHLDYKTGDAAGATLNPDLAIPCDGSVHTWELKFEPDVTVANSKWPYPNLPNYLPIDGTAIHTDSVLVKFQKDEPSMTKEKLLELLLKARNLGLVDDWYRKGKYHLWNKEKEPEKIKGKITFTFDGESTSFFLMPGHQDQPFTIDRFGFWNMQVYTGSMEFYVSDLIVNNHQIDLSQDPHWQGINNRVTFEERDFHGCQNFGYSQTNWAGENIGEIGGRFYGTEVDDPLFGYYATDIGELTLEDPISFSGNIIFTEGAVDGRMLIGYFNKSDLLADITGEYKGFPPAQYIGLSIVDGTSVGYRLEAICSPFQKIYSEVAGPVYIPDRIVRPFKFDYDPNSGEAGRITASLGDQSFTLDLTPEQRKAGSKFDRFGLFNPRKGGKYVDVYFDDIKYSSRKPKAEVKWYEQKITKEPYPAWGREHF